MAFQSFAKAYNARRHEGEGKVTLPEPLSPGRAGAAPPWSPKEYLLHGASSARMHLGDSRRPTKARGEVEGQYSYTLVRSDLEEDHLKHGLPEMPKHHHGMRQRTMQFYDHLRHAREDGRPKGPMAWVDSDMFHGLSGLVICINAVLIGLETDIDTPLWFYMEEFLLIFFVFELTVRLMRHGAMFFRHEEDWIWNWFDFSIVASGVFDQWTVPLLQRAGLFELDTIARNGKPGGKMSVFFMLMRMLRLLRIVRLFRLVRIVRPLYELAQGVLEALQGMFWVLVFLLMTLYTVAILCTRLIGHGEILPEEAYEDDAIREIVSMFTTVENSMFTLFGTMSSWSLLKFVPLFGEMPLLKPLFVIFYVYSAWALLAVMTGVVSENMIAIREQMVKEDEQREEMRKSMITKTLIELFQNADTDHSGTVSKQEFETMLSSPDLARKIERNTHLKIRDLQDLFDWLDHDGSGTITVDEFMKGFKWVNEPLRAKSLVKLQERLGADLKSLEGNVTETLERRVAEVQKLVALPLRKVHAITEQMQTLDVNFGGLRTSMKELTVTMPTAQELRDVEAKLTAKLVALVDKLEQVERAAIEAEGKL